MGLKLWSGLIAVVFVCAGVHPSMGAQNSVEPPLSWAPPGIDEVKPPANTQEACPLPEIVAESSHRVQSLVDNMQKFGANEQVEFEEFDKNGQRHNSGRAKFEYAAYIHEDAPQQLTVEEYRNASVAPEEFPSKLATTGTAAFALIFHPDYLKDFVVTCEGRTELRGRQAWRLHLSQTKPNNFRGYRLANRYFSVMLKARAWIDAQTFEVLRLETNLRDPIPAIPLLTEQVIVDYGMVEFPKRNLKMWLPQSADIYMDYRGKRYHHRHTFSQFQLFLVGTTEKVNKPKG